MVNETTAGRWFRRIMWVGIVANLALALPTIAAPAQMLAFSSLPTATPDLWPRFAALLLVLLTVFYIPAALDVDRFRATAWFAVASRLAGAVFFALEPSAYRLLMYLDLMFFVPLAILLSLAVRSVRPAAIAPSGIAAI